MPAAPLPPDEQARLAALRSYDVLDSLPEAAYDDLSHIAAQIAGTPIALVSLIDEDRQWFKARVGLEPAETPRSAAFCAHAILTPDRSLVVEDATQDERFTDNPLVLGAPDIRFYAGAPLVTSDGHALGTLCVIDDVAHERDDAVIEALEALARQVVAQLELGRQLRLSEELRAEQERVTRELRATEEQLRRTLIQVAEQSVTDELTGLPNRRALRAQLADELDRHTRYGTDVSIAMLDLDHFKRVNDQHGHQAGDEALRLVAAVLHDVCRTTDLPSRYGGEEFVVLLPSTEREGARLLAERIRAGVEELRAGFPLTVSVGVATAADAGTTPDELLSWVDEALYAAKALGRNRVVAAKTRRHVSSHPSSDR